MANALRRFRPWLQVLTMLNASTKKCQDGKRPPQPSSALKSFHSGRRSISSSLRRRPEQKSEWFPRAPSATRPSSSPISKATSELPGPPENSQGPNDGSQGRHGGEAGHRRAMQRVHPHSSGEFPTRAGLPDVHRPPVNRKSTQVLAL